MLFRSRNLWSGQRQPLALGTVAMCAAAFALVIWIKLRVVTAVPRTAFADPDQQQIAPKPPAIVDANHTPEPPQAHVPSIEPND